MLPAVWLIRLTRSLASIVPVMSISLLTAVSFTIMRLTATGPFFFLPLPALAALVCLAFLLNNLLYSKKAITNASSAYIMYRVFMWRLLLLYSFLYKLYFA